MTVDVIVRAEHVSKRFCKSLRRSLWYGVRDIAGELVPFGRAGRPALRPGEFWALDDVSFELRRGEALGIIGPNGAGKSTLLKLLNGLLKPDAGRITVRGRAGALIELGAGFNPVLTGRENVYINAAVLGLARRQVDAIFDQIIDFAEIGDFIDAPVQNYSSGMWVRLAFAVAAHVNPQVLLVDEVLAVGDMSFRRKCIQHIQRFLQAGGALVLVSHDAYLVQSVCRRALLLQTGRIVHDGTAVEAINRYFETLNNPVHEPSVSQDSLIAPDIRSGLDADHPVIITKVEITPLAGDELRTGEDVRLTVEYQSIATLTSVAWGFRIWTRDQMVCISAEGLGAKKADTLPLAGVGQQRFGCTIRQLPLLAGTYALSAYIADVETGVLLATYGVTSSPAFFQVVSAVQEMKNLRGIAGALVRLDVEY